MTKKLTVEESSPGWSIKGGAAWAWTEDDKLAPDTEGFLILCSIKDCLFSSMVEQWVWLAWYVLGWWIVVLFWCKIMGNGWFALLAGLG